MKSTKDRLLDEAIALFSVYGYDATGVDRIASAVGIKAPSIYKHYAGKEELLCAALSRVQAEDTARYERFCADRDASDTAREDFGTQAEAYARTLLAEQATMGRKFLTLTQFRDARAAGLLEAQRARALADAEEQITVLMRARVLRDGDPRVMARALLCTVWERIASCDAGVLRPNDACKEIAAHADALFRLYRRDADAGRAAHTPLGRSLPVSLM